MKKELNYNDKFKSFYNSSAWIKLRNTKFANANGLCENCLSKGIVKAGKEVHHIKPIEDRWDKRLDYDNLKLLCRDCHNEVHERISPLQKFLKEWED